MAYILEVPNPFEPLTNIVKNEHEGGITIWEWLKLKDPEFEEFDIPTICIVNGKALLREEWVYVIQTNDVVNFIAIPQGPFLVITAILVIAAIALAIFFSPVMPGGPPEADPVFSAGGQTNGIRLGQPIEVNYGRNRIFPSMAARPYFQYIDNNQFQYSLFCIGQGEYSISDVQIGDTDISDYEEVEYEIVEPGGSVSLFPTGVYTAVEVGNQTLYASNEVDYPVDGWVGPFPANEAGTTAREIQVDLVYPKGLHLLSSKGNLGNIQVDVEAQARLIDDAGTPLSAYFTLFSPSPYALAGATTTPQRRTVSVAVASGRYEVRLRRTNAKNTSTRAANDVAWESMRSYIDTTQEWGDVTLLAVKIRATSNLNSRTREKFNVIATRKLPVYESGGTWSAPQATRSIVWAFADVLKANYGGRLDDAYIDLDTLLDLDATFASRSDYFDFTFRDATTVWEALRTITTVGRGVPLVAGSLITLKRDGPLSTPVTMFTQDNIVKGSFEWNVRLTDFDEHDSLEIEYTEPSSGYKQETVMATLPDVNTTDNPRNLRMLGVQNRDHAYRNGLYILASQGYLKETIRFDTGLEGYIPTFGDLIVVACDIPRWMQSGYILHAVDVGGSIQLWLSEPIDWSDSFDKEMYLRTSDGSLLGPYPVAETVDPNQALIYTTDTIDFLLGGKNEPMLYILGVASLTLQKLCKVTRVEPQGRETVKITCVNYQAAIYSYDDTAPALPATVGAPAVPDLPTIANLSVFQIDGVTYRASASWTSAYGAQSYIVQTSEDGTNWEDRGETNVASMEMAVRPGTLWVRVAAINEGQGAWISDSIEITILQDAIITVPWDTLEWEVSWWEVPNITGYIVRVYDNTSPSNPDLKRTTTQLEKDFLYAYADAVVDSNLVREMLVTVNAVFEEGEASDAPVEVELSNAIPTAPTGMADLIDAESFDEIHYSLSWTLPNLDDLVRIKVWVSSVNGFDPEVDSPYYDFTAASPGASGLPSSISEVLIPIDTTGGHDPWYWRVAVYDVWGQTFAEAGICAQQTIAAYTP